MIIPFIEYLHEDWEAGIPSTIIDEAAHRGLVMDEDDVEILSQKAGRPFYEIALDCTINTDTGKVVIIGFHPDEEQPPAVL